MLYTVWYSPEEVILAIMANCILPMIWLLAEEREQLSMLFPVQFLEIDYIKNEKKRVGLVYAMR